MIIDFFRLCLISWVRAPAEEIFFFWNLILNGLFSYILIYSNILESLVIKIRGQDNLKTQKIVQEIREIVIAIYLCNIHFYSLINYSFFYQASMVCWLARWASDLKVVSSSLGLGERFYSFFFPKWDKKWRNMWSWEGVHSVRVMLEIFNFSVLSTKIGHNFRK